MRAAPCPRGLEIDETRICEEFAKLRKRDEFSLTTSPVRDARKVQVR